MTSFFLGYNADSRFRFQKVRSENPNEKMGIHNFQQVLIMKISEPDKSLIFF